MRSPWEERDGGGRRALRFLSAGSLDVIWMFTIIPGGKKSLFPSLFKKKQQQKLNSSLLNVHIFINMSIEKILSKFVQCDFFRINIL